MVLPTRRAVLVAAALAFAAPLSTAATAQDAPTGPVLLTLTGKVSAPNRGASGDDDKFFGYQDESFELGTQFDYDKLRSLPNVTVKADFPKDGPIHSFEGPLLADVLKAAGASGETVTIQALDGYAVDVPMQEMIDQGAVVALARDGKPFGIGDYGPTQIVFPRAERTDLADMPDDNWVWSIFHIRVE